MKSREEKRLRKLSMSQDKIDELHEYDYRLLDARIKTGLVKWKN